MPKRIGKYELGRIIGAGTFSKVCCHFYWVHFFMPHTRTRRATPVLPTQVKECTDTENVKKYAVKIVDKSQLQKEHMEQQLKREIAIMKLLDHENVLKMTDVLQTSKNIYLVCSLDTTHHHHRPPPPPPPQILELLTGGDLFDKLDTARWFDEAEALKYFHQLVSGLYYLHSQGIAHRDLKPENLLLNNEGRLHIADFGFSRLLSSTQLLRTVCGTPNYMAPEVLMEEGYDGKKADIWSCGVILYAMLAGYLPFDHSNMTVLCAKIEKGVYRRSSKFSPQAVSIIDQMLTVDPEKRITLDGILKHPFFVPGFDYAKVRFPCLRLRVTPRNTHTISTHTLPTHSLRGTSRLLTLRQTRSRLPSPTLALTPSHTAD